MDTFQYVIQLDLSENINNSLRYQVLEEIFCKIKIEEYSGRRPFVRCPVLPLILQNSSSTVYYI